MSAVHPDHEGEGVTIAAAADALGVSENAIRQRIKRQTLPAHKVAGVWRVWLPAQEGDHQTGYQTDHQATTRPTTTPSGRDHQADQEANGRALGVPPAAMAQLEAIRDQWLRPLVAELNAKAEEIGRLQAERDALKAEITSLRTTHDVQENAVGRQGEAKADARSPDTPYPVSGDPTRPWWKVWGRG